MDQVLEWALEGPLPQLLEEAARPIAPIAPPPGESPAAHQ
jgi:hypothetical protein